MLEVKKNYEAPTVTFLKFDAKDTLATSGWNLACIITGYGSNAEPPGCDIELDSDNTGMF